MRRSALASLLFALLAVVGRAHELPLDRVDPRGHSGEVVSVAFTPDGRALATAGGDGLAKVWDVAAGHVRADLVGHQGKLLCLVLSPGGTTVATGGEDCTVRLWKTSDGRELSSLEGHSRPVAALAFSHAGKTLASGSLDTTIRLWHVAGRRTVGVLKGHESSVCGLAFAPDGAAIVSASRDGTVRLWDVATAHELKSMGAHEGGAMCVAFAPNGKTVASGGLDQTLRYWNFAGRNLTRPAIRTAFDIHVPRRRGESPPKPPIGRDVLALAFAPDGRTVALSQSTADADHPLPGVIAIVNVDTRHIDARLKGHLGPVRSLAFAPDGKTLASGGDDRAIRLWDVKTATNTTTWLGPRPQDTSKIGA